MRYWVGGAVAGSVAGCGVVALMSWSLPTTLGLWCIGALLVVSIWVCVLPDEHRVPWRKLIGRSLPWPTATVAAAGLVIALGWTNAVLLTGAGLASAWEAGWLDGRPRADLSVTVGHRKHRWWRSTAGARTSMEASLGLQVVDPVEAVLEVTDELTDSDLCMAWRSSYVALDRAVDPYAKLRAVEIRELLLEELGRRDAPGLEAWFRSGARAAGGPDRYLRVQRLGRGEPRVEPWAPEDL